MGKEKLVFRCVCRVCDEVRAHYIRTRPAEYVAAFKREYGDEKGLRMWKRFQAESARPFTCPSS